MKRLLLGTLLACLFSSTALWAPPATAPTVEIVSSAPSGSCTSNVVKMVKASGVTGGDTYGCIGGTWTRMPVGVNELSATNSPAGNLCISVDPTTTSKFQFVACGSSSGGGGTSNVKECSGVPPCQATGNTTSSATTLAFGPGFDVTATSTVSSNDTANITIDRTEKPVILTTGSNEVTGTLPVANGGTGGATASAARTALGLAIGTDVQAFDTELTQIAAVAPTPNQILKYNGSAWAAAADSTGGTPTFDTVGAGTNINTALVVGNSSTLSATGTGAITATAILGTGVSGNISGTAGNVTGVVATANGGTGQTAWVQGDLVYSSATNVLAGLAKNTTATRYINNQGTSNGPAWAQVDLTNGVTGALQAANGGTGTSTFAQGDLFYGSTANTTISRLAKDANATRYLSNTGTTNNPAWAPVALGTGISGTLAVGNGGTGLTGGTSGGIPYYSGAATIASTAALALNGVVIGQGAGNAPITSATTLNSAGSFALPTGQQVDIAADATNGGSLTLKEGVNAGSDSWILKIADSGGTANTTVTINSDGTLPISAVGGATASKCARFNGSGVLVAATGDCTLGDTTGAGFADPGANGFVDRTALNTSSARTLTGSTDVAITNGGGGGNPVFSFARTATTASAALGANFTTFGTTGVLFEGATSDGNIGLLTAFDVPGDRTWTLPTETGTLCSSAAAASSGAICTIYAPVASPTFTGTPLAPTAAGGTNTTQIATTAFVTTATIRTDEATFVLFDPTTSDTNKASIQIPKASTVTRISCSSTGTSTTINVDKRDEATPNTGGSNLLSSNLACTTTSGTSCASGCGFNTLQNTSITARQLLNLQVAATSGTPTVVRVNVEYTTP